jgi:hypothetical protein
MRQMLEDLQRKSSDWMTSRMAEGKWMIVSHVVEIQLVRAIVKLNIHEVNLKSLISLSCFVLYIERCVATMK